MTDEKFEKAKEIKKKIDEYESILGSIRYEKYQKAKANEKAEKDNDRWTLSKFFTFRTNREKSSVIKLIPHYEFATGIEFDVDEDFVKMVYEYFKEKKKEAELEYDSL